MRLKMSIFLTTLNVSKVSSIDFEMYTSITPTMATMDVIVKIVFEVLTIFAITLHFLCLDHDHDKGSEV